MSYLALFSFTSDSAVWRFSELVLLVIYLLFISDFYFLSYIYDLHQNPTSYIRQHATRSSKKVVRLPRDTSLLRDWWGWGGEGKVLPSITPAKLLKTGFTRGDVVSSFRPPHLTLGKALIFVIHCTTLPHTEYLLRQKKCIYNGSNKVLK